MISMRYDFPDLDDELTDLIIQGKAAVARTANFVVQSAAQRMKTEIRSGPKSGRQYGSHIASAPGEAPADWTGYLASSITHTKMTDRATSEADVKVGASYAQTLEFGGFNESGRYVEPRPFIQPAIMEALARAEDVFDKELRKLK